MKKLKKTQINRIYKDSAKQTTNTAALSALMAVNTAPIQITGIYRVSNFETKLIRVFKNIVIQISKGILFINDISRDNISPIELNADFIEDCEQTEDSINLIMKDGSGISLIAYV